jgi:hypothetical protein
VRARRVGEEGRDSLELCAQSREPTVISARNRQYLFNPSRALDVSAASARGERVLDRTLGAVPVRLCVNQVPRLPEGESPRARFRVCAAPRAVLSGRRTAGARPTAVAALGDAAHEREAIGVGDRKRCAACE